MESDMMFWRELETYLTDEWNGEYSEVETRRQEELVAEEYGTDQSENSATVNIQDVLERMVDAGFDLALFEDLKPEHGELEQIELITKPLPLKSAIALLNRVNKFIENNGYTASDSGLHVNISIKNVKFNQQNFDPLKFAIFVNDQFMTGGSSIQGARFLGFAPRQFVGRVLDPAIFSESTIKSLAKSRNTDELLKGVSEVLETATKQRGINYLNAFSSDVLPENRRIEIRYIGGEDYEKRTQEIQFLVYRLVYMLGAAFDPEFARNEYLKGVIKLLDRVVKERIDKNLSGFSRYSKIVKSRGEYTGQNGDQK